MIISITFVDLDLTFETAKKSTIFNSIYHIDEMMTYKWLF